VVTRISKWVASDGKEFTSADEADRHEHAIEFVKHVHPESESRQVYDAIMKAQSMGWRLVHPPRVEEAR
jgi:hypothetical protein